MLNIVRLEPSDCGYPITVAEMKNATRDLVKITSEIEVNELVDFLAHNPECGKVIPETNGLRKMRWNLNGKGKSKGMRVIYYFHDLNMPLFILAVYSKGEILRLSKREERNMRQIVEVLKSEYRSKWEEKITQANCA